MPFAKAAPAQAFFKSGHYGPKGSGKTLTALLIAEYLAKRSGKRIAYIDTERGTDFYATKISERRIHPEAFDFDAIYTKSITESLDAVRSLDPNVHGVVVTDSVTHLWEAAKNAYAGKVNANGSFPIQAWGSIKKPYLSLMNALTDGQFHSIMCGREGIVMEEGADGELRVVGQKMKAEGETPYEPHFLLHFRPEWQADKTQKVAAFVEKDRTGILQFKTLIEPKPEDFEAVFNYLRAPSQGQTADEDAPARDAAAIEHEQQMKEAAAIVLYHQILGAIQGSQTPPELKVAYALTQGKKTKLGEYYDKLVIAKDARKAELMEAA